MYQGAILMQINIGYSDACTYMRRIAHFLAMPRNQLGACLSALLPACHASAENEAAYVMGAKNPLPSSPLNL
jgi:hypothetical protein